jgi:hypothetical protein
MNLLSLVGPRLDNICQIRRKWYYSSGSKYLQSKRGPNLPDHIVPANISKALAWPVSALHMLHHMCCQNIADLELSSCSSPTGGPGRVGHLLPFESL